jgi:hypothetical protein
MRLTSFDGVGVPTEGDNIVLVTSLGLSDDVVSKDSVSIKSPILPDEMETLRCAVLGLSVDVELSIKGSGVEQLEQSLSFSLADSNSWRVWAQRVSRATQSSAEGAFLVVVDHGAKGGGGTSESGLVTEWAVASGDEGNATSKVFWVIGLQYS